MCKTKIDIYIRCIGEVRETRVMAEPRAKHSASNRRIGDRAQIIYIYTCIKQQNKKYIYKTVKYETKLFLMTYLKFPISLHKIIIQIFINIKIFNL